MREDRPFPEHPVALIHLGIRRAVRERAQRFRDFRPVL